MSEELWMPCYETNRYEVSSSGRIRNVKSGRILRTYFDDRGREKVTLRIRGRQCTRKVHRLVAEAFYEEDLSYRAVLHRDCDQRNNDICNLFVGDQSDVIINSYSKLKRVPYNKRRIRVVETGEVFDSIRECSDAIGVNCSTISKCLNYSFYNNRSNLHFELLD